MFKNAVQSLVFLLGIVICVVPSNSWAGRGDPNFIDFGASYSTMEGYSIPYYDPSIPSFSSDLGMNNINSRLTYSPITDNDRGWFIRTAEAHVVSSESLNPLTIKETQKVIDKTKNLTEEQSGLVIDILELLSSVKPGIKEAANREGVEFRTGNIKSIMEDDLGGAKYVISYNSLTGMTRYKRPIYGGMDVFTLSVVDSEKRIVVLDESLFEGKTHEALLVALGHELGGNVTLIQKGAPLTAPYSENADLCRAYMECRSFQQNKETLEKLLAQSGKEKYLSVGAAKIGVKKLGDYLKQEESGFSQWEDEYEQAKNPDKSDCFIATVQAAEATQLEDEVGEETVVSSPVTKLLQLVKDIGPSWCITRDNFNEVVRLAEEAYNLAQANKEVVSKDFLEAKNELSRVLKSLGERSKDIKGDFSKAIEWYEKASSLASSGYERGKIDIDIMRCYQELAKEARGKGQFEQARSFLNKVVIKYEFGLRGSLILLSMDEDMAIRAAQESDRDIPAAYRGKGEEESYYIKKMELVGDGNFELGQSMYYLGAYAYVTVLQAFTEVEKILADSKHTYYTPWSYDEYEINLFKCLCYDKLGRDDEAFAELKKISSIIGLYKDAWKKRIEDRFYRETDIAAIGKYVGRYRLERELPDEYLMRESKGY